MRKILSLMRCLFRGGKPRRPVRLSNNPGQAHPALESLEERVVRASRPCLCGPAAPLAPLMSGASRITGGRSLVSNRPRAPGLDALVLIPANCVKDPTVNGLVNIAYVGALAAGANMTDSGTLKVSGGYNNQGTTQITARPSLLPARASPTREP